MPGSGSLAASRCLHGKHAGRATSSSTPTHGAVFLALIVGHHVRVPFHRALQRRIIMECLDPLVHARESGEIRTLPITWAEARRQGIEIERRMGRRA